MSRLILFLCLTSCAAGPRYDAQGNGTRMGDKLERWMIQAVNEGDQLR